MDAEFHVNMNIESPFNAKFEDVIAVDGDYILLENKPKINGIELAGDKTTEELNIKIPEKTSHLENDGDNGTSPYITENGLEQLLPKNIAVTDNSNNFSESQTFEKDVSIKGNLNVDGTTTTVNTQSLNVKDNIIFTNADGVDITTTFSGLVIKTGGNKGYGILYDPDAVTPNGSVKLGLGSINEDGTFTFDSNAEGVSDGNPIATRADSNTFTMNHLLQWDTENNRIVDSGILSTDVIKNTDYAKSNKAGIVWTNQAVGISLNETNGQLAIYPAQKQNIDSGANPYLALTLDKIDYAVKKGLAYSKLTGDVADAWTDIEKLNARELLGINDMKTIQPDENGEYTATIWELDDGLYQVPAGTKLYVHQYRTITTYSVALLNVYLDKKNNKQYNLFQTTNLTIGFSTPNTGTEQKIEYYQILTYTGAQTILGVKTFSTQPLMTATLAQGDSSTNIPNTQWVQSELTDYQKKTDETLNTNNKTIVGAINSILFKIEDADARVSTTAEQIGNVETYLNQEISRAVAAEEALDVKAENALSIAKGANQAISYDSYSIAIPLIYGMNINAFKVGQNIYIRQTNVPDLWISGINTDSVTYIYSSDDEFLRELKENGYVNVGHYQVSALETQKVDLTNYLQKSTSMKTVYAVDGAGNQMNHSYDYNNTADTLVQRWSDGTVAVSGWRVGGNIVTAEQLFEVVNKKRYQHRIQGTITFTNAATYEFVLQFENNSNTYITSGQRMLEYLQSISPNSRMANGVVNGLGQIVSITTDGTYIVFGLNVNNEYTRAYASTFNEGVTDTIFEV